MAASSSPTCSLTRETIASSSRAAAVQAASNRLISSDSAAASSLYGSRRANTSSTQYARATAIPGDTGTPFFIIDRCQALLRQRPRVILCVATPTIGGGVDQPLFYSTAAPPQQGTGSGHSRALGLHES